MKKIEILQALIKNYEYIVENNFMVPEGIGIGRRIPKERVLPQDREKISTGVFAEKKPSFITPDVYKEKRDGIKIKDNFVIFNGEYLPTGKQVNVFDNAIDLLYQIKELREELGIEGNPLKGETDILLAVERAKAEAREFTRTLDVSEIKEVAEGQTIESKNGAINAVTSPEEAKNKEGQSHNDE